VPGRGRLTGPEHRPVRSRQRNLTRLMSNIGDVGSDTGIDDRSQSDPFLGSAEIERSTERGLGPLLLGIDESQQGTPDRCLNSCRNAHLADHIVDMKVDRSLAHVHQDRNIS
jgi:hypothetical protein